MDITLYGDSIAVGALARFKYEWTEGGLSVVADDEGPPGIFVRTYRGVFAEVVRDGKVTQSFGDGDMDIVRLSATPLLIRTKKLAVPDLSPADISAARQIVKRYLVDDRPYNLDIPATLAGMVGWVEDKLAEIPEAARAEATFEFGTSYEYGETYPNIEITYSEPETDDEVIARLTLERERNRVAKEKDMAAFARLKAKYGG